MKPVIELTVHLESLDEIKRLLPDIAHLQDKYTVHLVLDVCATRTAMKGAMK